VEDLQFPKSFVDETPFIKSIAKYAGNVDVTLIQAENITPLEGIQRSLDLHEEPGHAASNAYWIIALMEEARNRGFRTILIGYGGNATVSWHGAGYLASLARKAHWRKLLQELHCHQRFTKKPLWRTVAGQILNPLIPWPLVKWINRIQLGAMPWSDYSAIDDDFASRLDLEGQMYKHGYDPAFRTKSDTRRARFEIIGLGRDITGCLSHEIGAGFALELRDPTNDKRVLEFCLSIPDDEYMRNGLERFLIRRAMHGMLPSDVLWNVRKGRQAADVGIRISKSQDEIKASIERIKKSESAQRFLNIEKMNEVLLNLLQNLSSGTTVQAESILLRGLMAGLFVLRFENMKLER
jgi:asparagine synthase (glutamine-hydrolysing)